MTAENTGKLASEGVWGTLKRVRDQWLVLAFLAGGLFWARDLYEQVVDLPVRVQAQEQAVEALSAEVAALGAGSVQTGDRSPALVFPGTLHGIGDGRPGAQVTAVLDPTEWVRADCRPSGFGAFMLDARGQWRSAETSLARFPQLAGAQRLAFGVRIHPDMAPGRAEFLLQVTQDCGSHLQVDSSPRLHFRVLAP